MSGPIAAPYDAFLQDLACVGVRTVGRGAAGRPYAVLAARTNRRWWLLPLSERSATLSGLAMFQPLTTGARLARAGVSALARTGLYTRFARHVVRFDRLPDLPGLDDHAIDEVAYFTGTDGPHRKTTVQLMRRGGTILGYARISRKPIVRPFLTAEAWILTRLQGLGLESAYTPRVLALDRRTDCAVLITDSQRRPGLTSPPEPGPAHLTFLHELRNKTATPGPAPSLRIRDYLVRLEPSLSRSWIDRFRMGLARLHDREEDLPQCLVHGDFTPTNCFELGSRLYVFDWEYALDPGPVGFDYAHYVLACPQNGSSDETVARLTERISAFFLDGDRNLARASLLSYLLLHAGFYMNRLSLDGQDPGDWESGTARAALVDAVLRQASENTGSC